jgi:hypothetical protein
MWADSVAQVVERLPSKHKTNTTKGEEEEEEIHTFKFQILFFIILIFSQLLTSPD